MDEIEEAKKILRDALVEMLAERHPVERALTFTGFFQREALELIREGEKPSNVMSVMLMQLIQTCNRHPEWMRAVCEDQKWITEEHDRAAHFEDACLEMISWYPLPPKFMEVPRA